MEVVFVLLFYGLIGAAVLGLGVLLYLRAFLSRKVYRCPKCREVFQVELMNARYCNVCGAPLHSPEDSHD